MIDAPTPADRALKNRLQEQSVKELWMFIGAVILLFSCINAGRYFFLRFYRTNMLHLVKEKSDSEPLRSIPKAQMSFRRLPAVCLSVFRIVAFRLAIPIGPNSVMLVSELTFICGYIIVIFTCLLVNTENLKTMFYEDRAALMAASQLPLVVALAGKNNVISFLTGVGYEKLNVLHRAAARTLFILLWMHAISRVTSGLPQQFDFSHSWMKYGATSLAAFSVASILSIRAIRTIAYEFFLITHMVLIAVFLVCGFLHARSKGFGNYIWPALLLWGLDRTIRIGGLFWNNCSWIRSKLPSTANIEILSECTVRLTLRRPLKWKAGQHAYVIVPSVSNIPTEAHPFTIASISDTQDGTAEINGKKIVFLIRGRSGFTGRLRDYASRTGLTTIPALIDGPYGYPPDLSDFSTCILIAGGAGVSYIIPLLQEIIRSVRAKKSITCRVVFIWAVRDQSHFAWIAETFYEALRICPESLSIQPRIHITQPMNLPNDVDILTLERQGQDVPPSSLLSCEKKIDFEHSLWPEVKLVRGRPDIPRLLEEEITAALGPVSVDVAGPSTLAKSVRAALCSDYAWPSSVLRGVPAVSLHVETFGTVNA